MAIPLWLFTVIHKSPPKYTQVYLLRMDTNYNFIIIRLSIRNGIRKIELCYRKTYPDKHYIYSWQSETCSGECTCLQTTGSLNTNAVHGVLVTFQRRVEIVQQKQTIITRRTTRYHRSCENSLLFHPCNVPPPPSPPLVVYFPDEIEAARVEHESDSPSFRDKRRNKPFSRGNGTQECRYQLHVAIIIRHPMCRPIYTRTKVISRPFHPLCKQSFYIMIYQVYRSNIYP